MIGRPSTRSHSFDDPNRLLRPPARMQRRMPGRLSVRAAKRTRASPTNTPSVPDRPYADAWRLGWRRILQSRGNLLHQLRRISLVDLSGVPAIAQPIAFLARDDVEVHMRHDLPC